MPLQPNGRAPYTSVAATVIVIDAFRDKGLGTPLTPEVLIRAGVSESIAKRTLNSLIQLELVDESGEPTGTFENLKTVRGEEEYRTSLQDWLRDLYGDVLQYCDPSTDDPDRIRDAFRGYQPEGQRPAMASLLLGLWSYAELPVVVDRSSQPSRSTNRTTRRSSSARKPTGPPSQANTNGIMFGVTDADIAALTESEFDEVWNALGKVARARARKPSEDSQVSDETKDKP